MDKKGRGKGRKTNGCKLGAYQPDHVSVFPAQHNIVDLDVLALDFIDTESGDVNNQ